MLTDFITTLDSDDEGSILGESSKTPRTPGKEDDLDPDFEFDFSGGGFAQDDKAWGGDELLGESNSNAPITVDDIIARRSGKTVDPYQKRKELKRKRAREADDDTAEEGDMDGSSESEHSEEEDTDKEDLSDDGSGFGEGVERADDVSDTDEEGGDITMEDAIEGEGSDEEGGSVEDGGDGESSASEEEDTPAEAARKDAFFSKDPTTDPALPTSFAGMNLSRPLLRALTALSLNTPTPIQARSIPLALLGRDILGSAVTGSGKTAAFMIPILERLCYRDRGKGGQACRVLVLCPTRELAVQCEAVGRALAEKGGMDVRLALLVGGLSLSAQAQTLRTLPDILIATPGRLIDHLNNTPSFTLSALDVLVIDEADRMLEAGFNDELEEIIKACPRSRQTMLFSATMTDSVDELVKLSLDRPVRLFVDPKRNTAVGLTQEFVRIRSDDSRSPSLLALCRRTVHERCIIFFRSKALAHQMRVMFGLCGLKAAELHGNLTQEQRLNALDSFKAGKVDYLLATDLASRGLDIKGVETVINYDMPGQLSQYTHRVGRTARAGRKGRSITLVGEADRKMLKAAIKQSNADQIRHRIIPAEAVTDMAKKLDDLKDEIQEILKEEREEKLLRQADMELKKGQNMVEHEAEIFSRPARTWFQSEKEKQAAKSAGKSAYIQSFPDTKTDTRPPIKRGKYDGLSRQAKRRKMALEDDESSGAALAAVRAAKKGARPTKITLPAARPITPKKTGKKKKSKSAFDSEKKGASHEGMRAARTGVSLAKKGKGKGGKGGKPKGKR